MSQSRQNMRSAFSEFEPEVSDAHVEQSWEKMKYFLPQKKKRRAFFFLDFSGFAKLAAMITIVALGFLLYPYESSVQKQTKQNKTAEVRTPDAGASHAQQFPEQAGDQLNSKTPSSTPNAAPEQNTVPDKARETVQNSGNGIAANNRLPKEKESATQRVESAVAGITNQEPVKTPETAAALVNALDKTTMSANEAPQQLPANSFSQASQEADPVPGEVAQNTASERTTTGSAPTKETELVSDQLSLKQLALLSSRLTDSLNPSLDLSPVKGKRELLLMSVRKKILIEAAAGPALSYAMIDPAEGISNKRQSGLSVSLGAAYYFKKRWSLTANGLYTSSKWEHIQEKSEGFKVIRKTPNTSNIWTGSVDTTKLVEVKSRVTLSSRSDYAFGIGVASEVWRSKKLSIEPFVQLAMRYSEYKLTHVTLESADTLRVVRISNAQPAYRVANPGPEYSENYRRYVFGIVPGLNVNYWLSPKLALFAKPQFMAQLSAEEIKNQSQRIKLRQDRLSLLLGLRIKIGG